MNRPGEIPAPVPTDTTGRVAWGIPPGPTSRRPRSRCGRADRWLVRRPGGWGSAPGEAPGIQANRASPRSCDR
jgi:hypothetical protein